MFFFEVCQVERKNQVARKYEEPSEAKAPEGKKWYLNSAATRYSGNKIDPSSSTGKPLSENLERCCLSVRFDRLSKVESEAEVLGY